MKDPFKNVNPKRCMECDTIIDVNFKDIKNGNIAICPVCKCEQNIKDMKSAPSVRKNIAETWCYNIIAILQREDRKNELQHQS